ncbi:EPM2AIP1 [Cordylochernes scorpioides]|uniref:EPM2AIP1 n=1 Tax=Cordylochernes scorpioides TaxID=51811 RepID=A0ABY6LP79_9ARAC|nr:EPM2AIP1 [Cordylochernes scorpioides]
MEDVQVWSWKNTRVVDEVQGWSWKKYKCGRGRIPGWSWKKYKGDRGRSTGVIVEEVQGTVITKIEKYNAKQHYMTHSSHKYAIIEGEARKTILQQLKNEKLHRQQTFNKFFQQNNNATEATYKVAYILGKRGKPFSDVEMIKECIVEVVKCLHPEKVDKYKQLPLSRRTITERQHELATNIKQQFCNTKIIKEENIYFSIALDESTDNTDSAQALSFIQAITEDFRCFEEFLALGTLSGRTRGIDILENFKIKICEAGLNINNLVSVCTDGTPAMAGKREGLISLLKKEYANLENLIYFHCILHQQNLCAKSASLNDNLEYIIGIVYFFDQIQCVIVNFEI